MTDTWKEACVSGTITKEEYRLVIEQLRAAVAMENNAELTSVKGLGRSFAWGDLYKADDNQYRLFPESPIEEACECYDGEAV